MLSTVLNHRSGFSPFPVCHPLVQPIFRMPCISPFVLLPVPITHCTARPAICPSIHPSARPGGAPGLPGREVRAHARRGGHLGERGGVRGVGEGGRSFQQGETCANEHAHVPHQSPFFFWVPVRATPCRILASLVISQGRGVYL